MLGKCIKHEFRATKRQLVPLFLAMLAVGLVAGLLVALGGLLLSSEGGILYTVVNGLLPFLLILGLFGLMVAVEVVAFVMIIRRFYTAFFTDEGYLSFTLPVTANEHILSKFIVALIWQLLAGVVSLVAMALVGGGALLGYGLPENFAEEFADLMEELAFIFSDMSGAMGLDGAVMPIVIVLYVLLLLVAVVSSILLLYFSISLGCMVTKKHRVLSSIVCYYAVSTVFSIISSIFQTIFQFTMIGSNNDSVGPFLIATLVSSLVLTVVQVIVCYIGTKWILEKKINLD